MKKNIHPPYHEVTLVFNDGEKRTVMASYGKPGAVIHLDVDCKTHPAWTGQKRVVEKGSEVEKFNSRYGGLGSL